MTLDYNHKSEIHRRCFYGIHPTVDSKLILRREFIKLWKEYDASPSALVYDMEARLVATTQRTLNGFFSHENPSRTMLTKVEQISPK